MLRKDGKGIPAGHRTCEHVHNGVREDYLQLVVAADDLE